MGDPNNFKFLVKWEFSSYNSATWEDELVVKIMDQDNFLEKYLHKQEAIQNKSASKYNFLSRQRKQAISAEGAAHS